MNEGNRDSINWKWERKGNIEGEGWSAANTTKDVWESQWKEHYFISLLFNVVMSYSMWGYNLYLRHKLSKINPVTGMGSLLKVVGLWGSRGYTNNKGYYCCPQCILDLEGNNLLLAIPQNSETGLGRIGWELEASSLRASSYTIYQKMLCKLLREKSSQKPYQTVNPTYYNNYQPGKISLIAQ